MGRVKFCYTGRAVGNPAAQILLWAFSFKIAPWVSADFPPKRPDLTAIGNKDRRPKLP